MKLFEIWNTEANVKIAEIVAENVDEAWMDYVENISEYIGTNDIEYIEIRYKQIT